MSSMKRVLLIGLDGFSPDLVEQWIEAGLLPNLERLEKQGALLPMTGVVPPITFPAWTSIVTGVNPGRHGIVDFTDVIPGRYAVRFMNSTDRRVPALWNCLSDANKSVCVLGVPGTYPPEPVNGILMGGFDSPVADSIDASFVYPASAYSKVRDWRFAEFQEHRIGASWYAGALASLERKIAVKEKVALNLLMERPWELFMVVFGEADTVSHHFWPLEDTRSPRHIVVSDAPAHPVRRIYERLDATVGRLMEHAGEDTLVMVVSDHGFGGAHVKALHINNFLAGQEWLFYARPGRDVLKRAALRWLPIRGRGRLFRMFKGQAERAESGSRFGGIDWSRTRAWSEELDYFPSVRLNLAGREPEGTVLPEHYENTVEALCRILESLPGVSRAIPRQKAYQGPYTEKAPDIVLELSWEEGYRYSCTRCRGGPAVESMPMERWAGGKESGCSGVHKNPAFFAINTPIAMQNPSMLDIAPTILDYLEVPGPFMEGCSLFSGRKSTTTDDMDFWTSPAKESYTKEEEDILEERMRLLGYFE